MSLTVTSIVEWDGLIVGFMLLRRVASGGFTLFFFFFKAVMSTVARVCKSFRRQGIERCNDIREISRNLLTINTL